MKYRLAYGALMCCVLPVAQAVVQGYAAGREVSQVSVHAVSGEASQRRRAELRSTLQLQQTVQGHQAPRQLTPQDRAELRQQLRRQRHDETRP